MAAASTTRPPARRPTGGVQGLLNGVSTVGPAVSDGAKILCVEKVVLQNTSQTIKTTKPQMADKQQSVDLDLIEMPGVQTRLNDEEEQALWSGSVSDYLNLGLNRGVPPFTHSIYSPFSVVRSKANAKRFGHRGDLANHGDAAADHGIRVRIWP